MNKPPDTIGAVVSVEIVPFQAPVTVYTKLPYTADQIAQMKMGFGSNAPEYVQMHISSLDSATLDALCEEFRRNVFENAGKPLPSRLTRLVEEAR